MKHSLKIFLLATIILLLYLPFLVKAQYIYIPSIDGFFIGMDLELANDTCNYKKNVWQKEKDKNRYSCFVPGNRVDYRVRKIAEKYPVITFVDFHPKTKRIYGLTHWFYNKEPYDKFLKQFHEDYKQHQKRDQYSKEGIRTKVYASTIWKAYFREVRKTKTYTVQFYARKEFDLPM